MHAVSQFARQAPSNGVATESRRVPDSVGAIVMPRCGSCPRAIHNEFFKLLGAQTVNVLRRAKEALNEISHDSADNSARKGHG